MTHLPAGPAGYSDLPGSAFSLVIDIHREHSGRAAWYAQRGIPEYWIVDQAPERSDDDALVLTHRLTLSGGKPAYVRERNLRLSELEAEYHPA